MSFKPCVLIPIYNHKERIRSTVERLLPHALPIFVVDDGSDDATRAVLAVLASEQPLLRLLRLPENAGKGAAVMAGMRAARRAGFSHALQVDADGQHDLADVPRFLERGFANPEAVVCGKALYDHTVPRSRRYGRYVTHFWVWVETLSLAIGDSMCGFRLYPLAASCALIDGVRIPTRMDFDIEIIVRLAWAGLHVENVATRVTYPSDGISHFDMLRDNLRISKMHPALLHHAAAPATAAVAQAAGARPASGALVAPCRTRQRTRLRIVFICYRLLGERTARTAALSDREPTFAHRQPSARRLTRLPATGCAGQRPAATPLARQFPPHAGLRAVGPRQTGGVDGRLRQPSCRLPQSGRIRGCSLRGAAPY